ncbi:MAG: hypothetical protein APF81_08590 [Desulfosporosinus sp. BRH_c37]|nr:MAG: hypothetical protein APF81_08590 [Desulfosporosinus sp. BRH_c37]
MRYIKLKLNKVVEVVDTSTVLDPEEFTQSDEGELGQILTEGGFIDDLEQIALDAQLALLEPTRAEIDQAEFELRTLNLLMEVGLI